MAERIEPTDAKPRTPTPTDGGSTAGSASAVGRHEAGADDPVRQGRLQQGLEKVEGWKDKGIQAAKDKIQDARDHPIDTAQKVVFKAVQTGLDIPGNALPAGYAKQLSDAVRLGEPGMRAAVDSRMQKLGEVAHGAKDRIGEVAQDVKTRLERIRHDERGGTLP